MLKDQILSLRQLGKTYDEIRNELGCSKGTIAYHLGDGQKDKTYNRRKLSRSKQHPFNRKLEAFFNKPIRSLPKPLLHKHKKLIQLKIDKFHYSYNNKGLRTMYNKPSFTIQDVIDKFGSNPRCYLTGQPIDIYKPRTYHFDHIIPASRGGQNTLDNLALVTKEANLAKGAMTNEEFIALCKSVIKHHKH